MPDPKGGLADRIRIFLQDLGIDPGYAVTIFVLLIVLSYRKDFKNWEQLESWRKGIIGSAVFAAVVLTLISVLRLLGVIEL